MGSRDPLKNQTHTTQLGGRISSVPVRKVISYDTHCTEDSLRFPQVVLYGEQEFTPAKEIS